MITTCNGFFMNLVTYQLETCFKIDIQSECNCPIEREDKLIVAGYQSIIIISLKHLEKIMIL